MVRVPVGSARSAVLGPPLAAAVALATLVTLVTGCITRPVKQDVYADDASGYAVEVFLREDVRGFSTVQQGYSHPVTIAPVRIAHILSRIDLRPEPGSEERLPAVSTDVLFSVAEGVSEALAQADENQQVVVMSTRQTKRWGLFDHDYLTSFLAYVRDERLYVHMGNHDWEIPKRRDDRLPEPRVGSHPQRFRLYPGTAMALVDGHSVAVDWRDPIFARPTRTKVLPGGEVVRKTILMESPPDEEALPAPPDTLPTDLSPEQLRDLADVEEARRQGHITETEYRVRRREILAEP